MAAFDMIVGKHRVVLEEVDAVKSVLAQGNLADMGICLISSESANQSGGVRVVRFDTSSESPMDIFTGTYCR
jgi:hypothetical protein